MQIEEQSIVSTKNRRCVINNNSNGSYNKYSSYNHIIKSKTKIMILNLKNKYILSSPKRSAINL